jgi:hypothetical protein
MLGADRFDSSYLRGGGVRVAVRAPIHAGTVRHSDLTCTPQLVITDEPSAAQIGGYLKSI